MKSDHRITYKNLSEDLKFFGKLPTMTNEMLMLEEDAEKAIGRKRAAIDIKIKRGSSAAKHDSSGYSKIMHRPRSISDVRRFQIASYLLLSNRLLIATACGMVLVSLFANDSHLMVFGSVLLVITFLLFVAQWMAAAHADCPLCGTPVLAPMGCVKHRKARRLVGSYKSRVALAIMFKERFRCPYCNEHTAMEVREKISGSRLRGAEMYR